MEEEAIKAAAETDKPVNDPVKEKIREFIVGKDLGKLRQYEVYFQLYPDQVTPRMFQEAWQSVMNEQPATEATGGPKLPTVEPEPTASGEQKPPV